MNSRSEIVEINGFVTKMSLLITISLGAAPLMAANRSGALSFLEKSDAKYASLGEAGTAATNDVAVMNYNPAGLGTLRTGQASFMFQKGLTEDAFGRFMVGTPTRRGAMALSVGYYDAGSVELDDGTAVRELSAQKDYMVALGFARNVGGAALGLNAKVLRSTLVEEYSANAYALDFGMQMPMTSRLRIGLAAQNIGRGLKYVEETDRLPTNVRLGASFALRSGMNAPTILLDVPYFLNERETRPSAGLDIPIGPLSLRAGYKDNGESNEMSFGAGFGLGRAAVDYSLGMADQLNTAHRVSVSMRFGGTSQPLFVKRNLNSTVAAKPARRPVNGSTQEVKRQKPRKEREVVAVEPVQRQRLGTSRKTEAGGIWQSVHIVRPGDNLATIAKRYYGDSKHWTKIYSANTHLIEDPRSLVVGQKIVLP